LTGSSFGDNSSDSDPDADGVAFSLSLRYPGQYFDAESGLHYNYFRDYDPAMGRYVESDELGLAGGISTYSYTSSNPLKRRDVFGLLYTDDTNMTNWVAYWNAKILEMLNSQCNCMQGGCYPCELKPVLLTALFTTEVKFKIPEFDGPAPNESEPSAICGVTSPDRTTMTLVPATFSGYTIGGGICGRCAASVVFHELLHTVGLDHLPENNPNDPKDPVWAPQKECEGILCQSGGPLK
jgi:RHS repeat-associated protein